MCICIFTYRFIYRQNLFPPNTKIVGYARSSMTVDDLRKKAEPFMKVHIYIFLWTIVNMCAYLNATHLSCVCECTHVCSVTLWHEHFITQLQYSVVQCSAV